MAEMSFLNSEVLAGDLMSPFDQSGLGAEESLGLLDDYLEVAKHFKPHGFSSDKAKAGSSEWLAMDGLVSASDTGKGKWDSCSSLWVWCSDGFLHPVYDISRSLLNFFSQRMPFPGQIGCWRKWI